MQKQPFACFAATVGISNNPNTPWTQVGHVHRGCVHGLDPGADQRPASIPYHASCVYHTKCRVLCATKHCDMGTVPATQPSTTGETNTDVPSLTSRVVPTTCGLRCKPSSTCTKLSRRESAACRRSRTPRRAAGRRLRSRTIMTPKAKKKAIRMRLATLTRQCRSSGPSLTKYNSITAQMGRVVLPILRYNSTPSSVSDFRCNARCPGATHPPLDTTRQGQEPAAAVRAGAEHREEVSHVAQQLPVGVPVPDELARALRSLALQFF